MGLSPAVSPDGKRIAYTAASVNSFSDIFIIDVDGNNCQQITTTSGTYGAERYPDWIDNQTIVYSFQESENVSTIKKVDINTKQITQLTSGGFDEDPSYANGKIMFESGDSLAVMDVNGRNRIGIRWGIQEILEYGIIAEIDLSKDANRIVFFGNARDKIYKADISGDVLTNITELNSVKGGLAAGTGTPGWSPDESKIAFTSTKDGSLYCLGRIETNSN